MLQQNGGWASKQTQWKAEEMQWIEHGFHGA